MVKRQRPKWREFAPLLRRPPKSGTRLERSLGRLANIEDLRKRGRRRTPRAAFDYVDGAADDEISLSRSRRLFRELEFAPNILRDVSECDPSTSILGRRSAFPFAFAPTGFTRMMHHEGEAAVASVASEFGIPYVLSTMGTTSPEGVDAAAPDCEKWFQLYVWRDRAVSEALIERVKASGFSTLVLTVDLPVGGARLRDVRNGMSIPPNLTLKAVLDGATHPRWWVNFLTTEPLTFASLVSTEGTVVDTTDKFFDASLNFGDLAWLRDHWDGPIVVKGVQNVDDVKRCVEVGAAGVILSNHGGRQLDRSPLPLRLIQPSVDAVGHDAEM